jgi:hypothetical protein
VVIWLLLRGHLALIHFPARLPNDLHNHPDVKRTSVLASSDSDATTGTHCRFQVSTSAILTERPLLHLHPEHLDDHKSSSQRCSPARGRRTFVAGWIGGIVDGASFSNEPSRKKHFSVSPPFVASLMSMLGLVAMLLSCGKGSNTYNANRLRQLSSTHPLHH